MCWFCDIWDVNCISFVCLDIIIKINKRSFSGHFTECYDHNIQQKTHMGTGKVSLPSVVVPTLGNETPFAECHLVHSAKGLTKGPADAPFAKH